MTTKTAAIGILAIMMALPFPARAETAANFLKSLSGTWRGSGTVYVSKKSKNSPVRCRITSTLDESEKSLRNKGRCATAQRKARVSGAINYSDTGNQISGSYLNGFGNIVITKSTGSITGNRLTLNTIFQDKTVSRILQARSIIERISTKKFIVTLFEKEGNTYQRRGKITFTR